MSEPICTTITIAVPEWYDRDPIKSDLLRQVTEWLDGEIYGFNEPGGDPVAGELWTCMGDIHYGISVEVQAWLDMLAKHGIEFDAHADEYCEYEAEQWAWRTGWDSVRRWSSGPDADGHMLEHQYLHLRRKHLEETYPADYLGFVEALDAFWPPALLVERETPPTSAVA